MSKIGLHLIRILAINGFISSLALKLDSDHKYVYFVNESKYDGDLNSIDAVDQFLKEKYFGHVNEKPVGVALSAQTEMYSTEFSISNKEVAVIIIGLMVALGLTISIRIFFN